MDGTKPCCRTLADSLRSASPFDRVIAIGFSDGPTEGFLRCGGCGGEYLFRMLDESSDSGHESDTRIFGLAHLPAGTIEQLRAAMAPYQRPPVGPHWSFPSESIRDQMSATVDRLEASAGPMDLVIASTGWLDGEVIASRAVSPAMSRERTDWFEFLGLVKAEVED